MRSIPFFFVALLLGLFACTPDPIPVPTATLEMGEVDDPGALEVDSLELVEWLDRVCATPHRRVGSENWQTGMLTIAHILGEIGFTTFQKDFFEIQYWECTDWSLGVEVEGELMNISSYYEYGTGFTGPEGITAPLVYVGRTIEEGEDVAGKIALIDLEFSDDAITGLPNPVSRPNHRSFPEPDGPSFDVYWQAKQGGAVGVIFIMADFHANVSEYMYIPHHDNLRQLPAQFVGNRDGIKMRCYAELGYEATIQQQGVYEPRETYNLWVTLPGQSEDNLIISTHADAPFRGVIEDGTGIVSVLAQAKEWLAVPEGQRPKTLYFVFTAAHFYKDAPGGSQFVLQHQNIIQRTQALVEIEHLGAIRQTIERDEFVPADLLSPLVIYHSEGGFVESEMMNMVNTYPPQDEEIELVPPISLFPFPLSEAAGWIATASGELDVDIPYVSFITNPTYLLTVDDDFDQVDMSAVIRANESIDRLVEAYAENL